MIRPELRIKEITDVLPVITIGSSDYKPLYDFGTQEDLYNFLKQKQSEVAQSGSGNVYPIIWMETPVRKRGNEKRITFELTLVIATLSNRNMSNIQREAVSFDTVLVPLYNNILTGLKQSGFTQVVTNDTLLDHSVDRTDYYNYGPDQDPNHDSPDIWDAIKLETEVIMTSNCIRENINF